MHKLTFIGSALWLMAIVLYCYDSYIHAFWLKVPGEVVHSESYYEKEHDAEQNKLFYRFTVRYELDGKEKFYLKPKYIKIPDKNTIVMFINPKDSTDVILDVGAAPISYFMLFFCGLFLISTRFFVKFICNALFG
jgi:hypothetical protein